MQPATLSLSCHHALGDVISVMENFGMFFVPCLERTNALDRERKPRLFRKIRGFAPSRRIQHTLCNFTFFFVLVYQLWYWLCSATLVYQYIFVSITTLMRMSSLSSLTLSAQGRQFCFLKKLSMRMVILSYIISSCTGQKLFVVHRELPSL